MKIAAQPIDVSILRSMRSSRGASVFSPRHFDGVGNPDAIRQALSRLVKAGTIRRIRRGLYDLPRQHPIIGQTAPDIMATVRALMDGSQAQWQFSGAYAANALGLSDQVPAKIVILTNGVPRRVSLGKLTLVFRRAAPRNLLGAGQPAGLAIQANSPFAGRPEPFPPCDGVEEAFGREDEGGFEIARAQDAGMDAASFATDRSGVAHGLRSPTDATTSQRTFHRRRAKEGH
jgi:Family of unknown function (DUF6088)